MVFLFLGPFQLMILNKCFAFLLKILWYLYFSVVFNLWFKSVFCFPSQDTMVFIFFRRFQFMVLNQWCSFHLRIVCYLYFSGVFNSRLNISFVRSISGYYDIYIFSGVFNSRFYVSGVCSFSGYYVIYIFQAFSIHDVKWGLCVPPQDTMVFIFLRRLNINNTVSCGGTNNTDLKSWIENAFKYN